MTEITEKLDKISNNIEHYLVKARNYNSNYFDDFLVATKIIKSLMPEKEFNQWLNDKMLINNTKFREKTFIQFAVESSVVRYFAENHNKNLQIEAQINPNNDKDVDIVFSDNEYNYNVEVKCADYTAKEEIKSKDTFKFETIGRLPDRGKEAMKTTKKAIEAGNKKLGIKNKSFEVVKNMDNNLKDFLESANEKFNPESNDKEVNILLVGCDDARDIQAWFNFLFYNDGLFTSTSFADKTKYENVDLVVFTNLYFKHNKYFEKKLTNSWSVGSTFNIVFNNPDRKLDKGNAIKNFLEIFPHYSYELSNYRVPGDAEDIVKDSGRIIYFVKEYLEKQEGIYLFEERK